MSDSDESQPAKTVDAKQGAMVGFGLLGAAAAVFILCSLVQGAFGSSMFDTSYRDPGIVGTILINLTFWPGWIGTVGLAVFGAFALWATYSKD